MAAAIEGIPMTTDVQDEQQHSRRADWLARVETVLEDVQRWSAEQNWSTHRADKTIREDRLGTYLAPTLRIRVPDGEIQVDPVALQVVGADGRIDLEAWPSLNRVKLIGRNGHWEIMTDSNVPLRQPWNHDTFVQLVHDLLGEKT